MVLRQSSGFAWQATGSRAAGWAALLQRRAILARTLWRAERAALAKLSPMLLLVSAFAVSFLVTLVIVRGAKRLERMVGDHDLSGPQKFHTHLVPRVGGLGIELGVVAGRRSGSQSSDKG